MRPGGNGQRSYSGPGGKSMSSFRGKVSHIGQERRSKRKRLIQEAKRTGNFALAGW